MQTTPKLHMETTMIAPGKTAGEIISELVAAGANQINQTYSDGRIIGIRWVMRVDGQDLLFDMPVRVEPVYVIFAKRRGHKTGRNTEGRIVYPQDMEKAERVAWRQLLRWIQAQVAMIQTGMVKAEEVFLPYWFDPVKSQTLFQSMSEMRFKALPAPEVKPQ